MTNDVVWQGIGASLVSAVISAVVAVLSALLVVSWTNKGARENARQERFEEAAADMILQIHSMWTIPGKLKELNKSPDLRAASLAFDHVRTRITILTGHRGLEESLAWMRTEWLEEALELAWIQREARVLGHIDEVPEESGEHLDELLWILRDMRSPAYEHATRTNRRLNEWHWKIQNRTEELSKFRGLIPLPPT